MITDLAAWLLEQIAEDQTTAQVCVNPARVLAECETKRRIIELHTGPHECSTYDHNGEIDNCTWVLQSEDCSTVRLHALPYADRPGYDESWRP